MNIVLYNRAGKEPLLPTYAMRKYLMHTTHHLLRNSLP